MLFHEIGINMSNKCFFELKAVTKRYGATTALDKIDLQINRGEILGLIGANGAGKSTLTRVLSGVTLPDEGDILHASQLVDAASFTPLLASRFGVRVVYQELSLCTNLSVYENFYVEHHDTYARDIFWHKKVQAKATQALDEIFPNHGIDTHTLLRDMPLSKRQMIEIARAISTENLELLILDEPTSSLGAKETEQLMKKLKQLAKDSISIIFITHRLQEVLQVADRIQVMHNGRTVWEGPNTGIVEKELVAKMTASEKASSSVELTTNNSEQIRTDGKMFSSKEAQERYIKTRNFVNKHLNGINLDVKGGELIGIAGLDGNGQRPLLKSLYYARSKTGGMIERSGSICYVSGDRKKEGIFTYWSISDNMGIEEINKSKLFSFFDRKNLSELVSHWYEKLAVKAESKQAPILSLSGGNQQKVLVARALLADADIIILDDPTKGVDAGTKQQMYTLFKEAAALGKLVIWYSTDDIELELCSRVLVLRYGKIVKELVPPSIVKKKIIEACFEGEELLSRTQKTVQSKKWSINSAVISLAAMLLVFGISGVYQRNVFTRFGVELLIGGSVPLVFAALSQMFIIGLSNIDLGIGAHMGLVNVLCATIMLHNPLLGFLLIFASIIVYGFMGAIVHIRKIPAVIVTMGMSFVWIGIAYTIQDRPGGQAPQWLINAFSLQLPIPQCILIILAGALFAFIFYRSKYGTVLRGFGNNLTAVERSGWSALKAYVIGYMLAGLFSMIGGLAITASTGASDVNSTTSYTMLTVAAVVMGGSSLLGGLVSPFGTIIGAVTLSLVGALLGFMRLNASYVTAVQGIILILILASRLLRKETE
ncbi:ATP-binding cassette domain-containing protein [uncultured Sphaerochaeta sp.]|uniref:ATP-binding cassette domain-containing protein n=1 Tax=uncultured Sphaerochaeta sp. TaxID=886478 RepID=UPI002A0A53C5|nr:ATP-binding cassette domain-containing protein [uncultured Sphaerochaeta sp.]